MPGVSLNALKCVLPLSENTNPVAPATAAVRLIVEEPRLAVTALLAVVIELAQR